jgi:hypothetical protein
LDTHRNEIEITLAGVCDANSAYIDSRHIDAAYEKVREAGRIISVIITIAVGVNGESWRELLGIAVGTSETKIFWAAFLRGLLGLARPAWREAGHFRRL